MKRFLLTTTIALCILTSLVISGGTVHAQARAYTASHMATSTTCKTFNLSGDWWIPDINPHMTLPACYNGSRIWQNGSVTPGVSTIGYVLNGVSWAGTYNSGGSWIGVGENYTVNFWLNWASFSCASRWMINASGNVISYNRGC